MERMQGSAWQRRNLFFALGVIGLVAIAISIFLLSRRDWRAEWVKRLDQFGTFDPEVLKQAGGGALELSDHIWKDIAHRPLWDVAEIDELWLIYGRWNRDPDSYPKNMPRSETVSLLVAKTAGDILGVRFDDDAPVTPAARERYISLLVEDLFNPVAVRRSDSALTLIMTKNFLEQPGIRTAVERLLDDPDEEVRKVVALQLGYHDEAKRRQSSLDERKKAIGKP